MEDSKRGAYRGSGSIWTGCVIEKAGSTEHEGERRRLLGKNFRFVQRIQPAASAKHAWGFDGEREEMKRQERMKVMKDMTKKIRSKERMDAENRWCVAELLAADCEKVWLYLGGEEIIQIWYVWLEEMRKENEKRKGGRIASAKGESDDQECGRECWVEAHSMERRSTDLEERRRGRQAVVPL